MNDKIVILPEDFLLECDDLKMRLVNEDDAEFILSLRANAERTKYMLSLDSDLEKQRNWIKEYKKRQVEGKDYYFIFEIGVRKMGVLRISNIDNINKKAKAANWIKIPSDHSITEKMFILWFFVIFDILNLESFYSDVHKDNKKSLEYFCKFCFCKSNILNDRDFIDIIGTRNDYEEGIERILKKYNISINSQKSLYKNKD